MLQRARSSCKSELPMMDWTSFFARSKGTDNHKAEEERSQINPCREILQLSIYMINEWRNKKQQISFFKASPSPLSSPHHHLPRSGLLLTYSVKALNHLVAVGAGEASSTVASALIP